jgi:Type IV secretion system pilin
MKKALLLSASTLFALPMVAFAAVNDLTGVGTLFIDIVNTILVPVLFALAFIVFIWGAFTTFILGATSEETKDKGKSLMLWGLIGFFVMISVWGLVNILTGTVTFGNNAAPSSVPQAGGL